MQDGEAVPATEAGDWLREHFTDDPAPRVDITWTTRAERDDAGFTHFLTALFAPIPDGPGA
ncbi:hypothetical protein [Streptomyces sp. NPDC126514]|uniref:hypothetical protein n=1 Tax=Streptomyces sp. NPDC126514 TaxID=3155210 RepID=UPI00331C3E3E